MRVLIADANESMLELLQSYLWDRGHEAEVAANARECLIILREFCPDVLVLDSDLPREGTQIVLRELSHDPALAETLVILTATRENLVEPAAYSTSIVSSLAKPYYLGDLLNHINRAGRFAEFETVI